MQTLLGGPARLQTGPHHQARPATLPIVNSVLPQASQAQVVPCTSSGHALSPRPARLSRRLHVRSRAIISDEPAAAEAGKPATEDGSAFASLGVDPVLVASMASMNITSPSPIQAAAIPAILSGSNVAVQSYTGSGKTLAYLLPAVTLVLERAERIYSSGNGREVGVQALIVAPSQELAMQVVRVCQSLLPPQGKNMVQQCIGGANPRNQQLALERNKPLIVVGTPGRLAEFMRTGVLRVHRTPLLVLDEADQLLAPQFSEDMTTINAHAGKRLGPKPVRKTNQHDFSAPAATQEHTTKPVADEAEARAPRDGSPAGEADGALISRQTVVVSATLSQTVLTLLASWCPGPQYVHAGGPAPVLAPPEEKKPDAQADAPDAPGWGWGVKGWGGPASELGVKGQGSAGGVEGEGLVPSMPPQLKHYVMTVDPQRKVDSLRRVIHALDLQRTLVFMNWQQRLKDVQFKLEARSMQVSVLHGEMPKVARQNVLNDFKRGRVRALVVSDVVARGLDVPNCDAVFHLELPSSASHYAHRAGRTGRMGAPGTVISMVAPGEVWIVDKLAARLGVQIQEVHVAHGELRMGPGPRKARHDDSDDEDEGPRGGKATTGAKAADQKSKSKAAGGEPAGKLKAGSPGPSQPAAVEGKTGKRVTWDLGSDDTPSGAAAAPDAVQSPAAAAPPVKAAAGVKGARVVADAQGEYESIIYDDEDEIELGEEEEEELEQEAAKLRSAASPGGGRGRGGRSGRGGRGARGGDKVGKSVPAYVADAQRGGRQGKGEAREFGPRSASKLKQEVAAELEELKAEKAMLKRQRYLERQGNPDAE